MEYSDHGSLPKEKIERITSEGLPWECGHTLEQQIGGQLAAGFVLRDLYEDGWDDRATPLNRYASMYVATLAIKLAVGIDNLGSSS